VSFASFVVAAQRFQTCEEFQKSDDFPGNHVDLAPPVSWLAIQGDETDRPAVKIPIGVSAGCGRWEERV
jgi:hypothetical protein